MTIASEGARARAAIETIRSRSTGDSALTSSARVALHFHPDFDLFGVPALLSMIADRRYVSQFVTGTSTGGLTARTGGDRWNWEHDLFAGVYDDAPPSERPVYGALMTDPDAFGPAPRFGSAYLRLSRSNTLRSTFCYPDSVFSPTWFGVADRMAAAPELIGNPPDDDPLNAYIEAHVHGGVRIPADVEAVVLDPCFRNTDLVEAAAAVGLPVEWHPGYALGIDAIEANPHYRGLDAVDLAKRLAVDGRLTPAILGRARGATGIDPQLLKFVWHYLARYGRSDAASVK